MTRPGHYSGRTTLLVPDPVKQNFWNNFYKLFCQNYILIPPIDQFNLKINPFFGYFGFRWHPINFQPRYFHIGIDITEAIGKPIQTVFHGFLEYSGFSNVNGNYIIIKHCDIKTKDGFILQSLYMHCNTLNEKFNLFQKITREYLSTKMVLSNINIPKRKIIANVGGTGNVLGLVPHLHLQLEFVKGKKHIAVDPLKLFNKVSFQNLTSNLLTKTEFVDFYTQFKDELEPWKKFWSMDFEIKYGD